jgi:FkbM family methyltransferase
MKAHVKYDAFLPHLCSHLPPGSFIIDIGANVGDTLAGIVSKNSKLKICCIEPDQGFLKYLNLNVESIVRRFPETEITVLPYLIGKEFSNLSLQGSGGTKHAIPGGGVLQNVQLDEALQSEAQRISLIKTDVDGFDFDVINSGFGRIATDLPLIFMEFYLQNKEDLAKYMKTSNELESLGYKKFVVFDNFGGVVIESSDLNALENVLNYAINGRLKKSTRTIDYFDVLFSTQNDTDLIAKVLASYYESIN